MSVPVKLRASADYDRPLFHPGQILSDTELTRLAECNRSLLAAEGRRHGWGVVRGLLPFAVEGTATITISAGMLCDQKGRLFELVAPETRNVSELAVPSQSGSALKDGVESFDLWLTIDSEQFGAPAANLKMTVEAGYAPEIDKGSKASNSRAVREAVTARLELRPAKQFDDWVTKRKADFDTFTTKFNKIDALTRRQARLKAVADAMSAEPNRFDGVPLGRLTIATKSGASVVEKIDWAEGRHEQTMDGLPVSPSHTNLAPLFDLTEEQAMAWLAHRGIQPWTIEEPNEEALKAKELDLRNWRPQVRAGMTVKLSIHDDRVVLAEPGPIIAKEIIELRSKLAEAEALLDRHSKAIIMLFVLGALITLILSAAIFWK
jgi:hypothetical protein